MHLEPAKRGDEIVKPQGQVAHPLGGLRQRQEPPVEDLVRTEVLVLIDADKTGGAAGEQQRRVPALPTTDLQQTPALDADVGVEPVDQLEIAAIENGVQRVTDLSAAAGIEVGLEAREAALECVRTLGVRACLCCVRQDSLVATDGICTPPPAKRPQARDSRQALTHPCRETGDWTGHRSIPRRLRIPFQASEYSPVTQIFQVALADLECGEESPLSVFFFGG